MDDENNDNTNCTNVVARNIAREMQREKNQTERLEDRDLANSSDHSDGNYTSQNACQRDIGTPNRTSSETSCESRESGIAFSENPENCTQFVEFQNPNPTILQCDYNRQTQCFLYNGQLYSTMASYPYGYGYGHTTYLYPQMNTYSQNVGYYQMTPEIHASQYNQQDLQPNTADETQNMNNIDNNESQQMSDLSHSKENEEAERESGSTENQPNNQVQTQNISDWSVDIPSEGAATNYIPTQIYYNQQYMQQPYAHPGQNNYPFLNSNVNDMPTNSQYPPIDYHQYHENLMQMVNNQQDMDKKKFQYPAIYVSTTGLITVLMKHDVSVETTVEQTIRLVSHQQKLVAAINSRGNASYLYHPAAHVMQDSTTTEIEVFLGRKVKMTTDNIVFANNFKCYKFDYNSIESADPDFSDLSRDRSVNFLFTKNKCNGDILEQCNDIVSKAKYERNERGGICIRINKFKIVQTSKGDVIVTGFNKYLRMSPTTSVLRLSTSFVDMNVEMNWNVKVTRGSHTINASHMGMVVSNGKVEAAFDENNRVHACMLPTRKPLLIDGQQSRGTSPR